ncbi:MAG: serine hydrolase, partial [Candidatus Kariarchaeaceae archaeon]
MQIIFQYFIGFLLDLIAIDAKYVQLNMTISIMSLLLTSLVLYFYIIPFFDRSQGDRHSSQPSKILLFAFIAFIMIIQVTLIVLILSKFELSEENGQIIYSNWSVFSRIIGISLFDRLIICILVILVFPLFVELLFHRYLLVQLEYGGMSSIKAILTSSLLFALTYSMPALYFYDLVLPVGVSLSYLVRNGSFLIFTEILNIPVRFLSDSILIPWLLLFWLYFILGIITGYVFCIYRKIEVSIIFHGFCSLVMYVLFLGARRYSSFLSILFFSFVILCLTSYLFYKSSHQMIRINSVWKSRNNEIEQKKLQMFRMGIKYFGFLVLIDITRRNASIIPLFFIGPIFFLFIFLVLLLKFKPLIKGMDISTSKIKNYLIQELKSTIKRWKTSLPGFILIFSLLVSFSMSWFVIPRYIGDTSASDNIFSLSTPEKQGMDANQISAIFDFISDGEYQIDSIIVIRNGFLVIEEHLSPEAKITHQLEGFSTEHQIASCTKSIISALIGIAINHGYLESTSSRMVEFFPDRTIKNNDDLKKMITIEDLLTMRAGISWWQPYTSSKDFNDPNTDFNRMKGSKDYTQYVLDQPMSYVPGNEWAYSSGNSHLLSGIIEKVTGSTTLAFAQKYLFEPMGIEVNYWPNSPEDVNLGGGALKLSPLDMAKFGYLYLNNGTWKGEQLIPKDYVSQSLFSHHRFSSNGYGYSWWTDNPENGVSCAIGAYGQYTCVAPNYQMVIQITANIR